MSATTTTIAAPVTDTAAAAPSFAQPRKALPTTNTNLTQLAKCAGCGMPVPHAASTFTDTTTQVARAHERIAELEAQIEVLTLRATSAGMFAFVGNALILTPIASRKSKCLRERTASRHGIHALAAVCRRRCATHSAPLVLVPAQQSAPQRRKPARQTAFHAKHGEQHN